MNKREEFSKIYSEYFPLLLNTVYTKVGNYQDAHDICQEIFIIFYNKFHEVENPRYWLFGTMKNVVYQHYRKKSKPEADIDEIFQDVSLTFVNGFRDTRLIIEEAIENVDLTEEERLLLDYIAFNNYSYTNVGKIMGLTKRQVGYKYLGVARKILAYLEQKGIRNIEDLL
jgi:RNA polymerase sigma-70 factor (ECF subfamily)